MNGQSHPTPAFSSAASGPSGPSGTEQTSTASTQPATPQTSNPSQNLILGAPALLITRNPKVRIIRRPSPTNENDLWPNFQFDCEKLKSARNLEHKDSLICYKINIQTFALNSSELGSFAVKRWTHGIWAAAEELERDLSQGRSASGAKNYKNIGIIEVCEGVEELKRLFSIPPSFQGEPTIVRKILEDLSVSDGLVGFVNKDQPGIYFDGEFETKDGSGNVIPERAGLFVRISFLGYEKPDLQPDLANPPRTSTNLISPEDSEYWLASAEDPSIGLYELPEEHKYYKSHDAYFLTINEEIILTSRSKELLKDGNLITLPGQQRAGVFHLLVHMIADVVRTQDERVQKELEEGIAKIQYGSLFPKRKETSKHWHHFPFAHKLRQLTNEQLTVLIQLQDTFSQAVYSKDADKVYGNTYMTNMLHTPLVSGKMRLNEQIIYAKGSLNELIDQRRKIVENCDEVIERMNKISTGVPQAVEKQTAMLSAELAAQKAQTEELTEEIAWQGKTLSVFTIVNVLFLPLGFFAQYFIGDYSTTTDSTTGNSTDNNSIYSNRNGAINSIGKFWLVTGFITFAIVFVATWFVFKSQYEGRKVWRCIKDGFTGRGWSWPLKKPDAHSQYSYIRRLPRYQVHAIPANPTVEPNLRIKYLSHPRDHSGQRLTMRDTPLKNKKVDKLEVKFSNNRQNAGRFAFDSENGWLFYPEVDWYDCTYHIHGPRAPPPPSNATEEFYWQRSRMLIEKLPWVFCGRFAKGKEWLKWKWASLAVPENRPMWDKSGKSEVYFRINEDKLFVYPEDQNANRLSDVPQSDVPQSGIYRLMLVKHEKIVCSNEQMSV